MKLPKWANQGVDMEPATRPWMCPWQRTCARQVYSVCAMCRWRPFWNATCRKCWSTSCSSWQPSSRLRGMTLTSASSSPARRQSAAHCRQVVSSGSRSRLIGQGPWTGLAAHLVGFVCIVWAHVSHDSCMSVAVNQPIYATKVPSASHWQCACAVASNRTFPSSLWDLCVQHGCG